MLPLKERRTLPLIEHQALTHKSRPHRPDGLAHNEQQPLRVGLGFPKPPFSSNAFIRCTSPMLRLIRRLFCNPMQSDAATLLFRWYIVLTYCSCKNSSQSSIPNLGLFQSVSSTTKKSILSSAKTSALQCGSSDPFYHDEEQCDG